MKEHKKKAVPVLHHQDGQVETGPASQTAPHLHDHDTTAPPPRQAVHIADFLNPGADHGVHLSDLVKLTGLPERTVRQMIHQERRKHIPILSNNKDGYFLPDSERERADCVRSLRARAAEILEAADGIEGAAGLD